MRSRPAPLRRPLALVTVVLSLAACGKSAAPPSGPAQDRVPVGYGTQERASITGSVSSVEAGEVDNRRVTRVEELLEGRVAGVQVIRTSSGGISLRIRGVSSINGSSEPLFVIDGMPVQLSPGMGLAGLNPNDVARIEILKDAGTTAIYGSRGANGVILITTKRH